MLDFILDSHMVKKLLPLVGFIGPFAAAVDALFKNSNIQGLVFRMSFVEPEFITFIFTFKWYFKPPKFTKLVTKISFEILWFFWGSRQFYAEMAREASGIFAACDETKPWRVSHWVSLRLMAALRHRGHRTEFKKMCVFLVQRVSFHEKCDWTKWWKKRWVCHFQNKMFLIVIEKTCFLVWKCIGIWVVDSSWIQ